MVDYFGASKGLWISTKASKGGAERESWWDSGAAFFVQAFEGHSGGS